MSDQILVLAINAASLGFIHTVLGPDHYLPFIVMSKARRWSTLKTGIITSLILIFNFSYGHLFEVINGQKIGHRPFLIIWGLLFIFLLFLSIKTKKSLKKLTAILNIVGLALIFLVLFNVVSYKIKNPGPWWEVESAKIKENNS